MRKADRHGLDLGMSEELPDHRQALAQGQRTGREGVSKVMNSYVLKPGALADAPPGSLQIGEVRAWQLASK